MSSESESCSSQGAFELAVNRGRSLLPRIIFATHCVDIFQRFPWSEGAFSFQAPPEEDKDNAKHTRNDLASRVVMNFQRLDECGTGVLDLGIFVAVLANLGLTFSPEALLDLFVSSCACSINYKKFIDSLNLVERGSNINGDDSKVPEAAQEVSIARVTNASNEGLTWNVVELPPKVLRLDGGMEAWLEVLQERDPQHVCPSQYASLNDAVSRQTGLSILQAGNLGAKIWFFNCEFLQSIWPVFFRFDVSAIKMWETELRSRGLTIQATHREVGQINYPSSIVIEDSNACSKWMEELFAAMQASRWTPGDEARTFLLKRHVSHASMSIGDIVQIGRNLFIAGLQGFVAVEQSHLLSPSGPGEFDGPLSLEAAPRRITGNNKIRNRIEDRPRSARAKWRTLMTVVDFCKGVRAREASRRGR